MSEEKTSQALSDDELQAFAAKLDAWGAGLTPKEQAFLIEIIERAATGGDAQGFAQDTEVARYNFFDAWPSKVEWVLPLRAIAAQRQ